MQVTNRKEMVKVCIVTGARPNFVKVAPIIRAIKRAAGEGKEISYRLIYVGPKDDPTIESSLFTDLQIGSPDEYLGVDCDNLNELAGKTMFAFAKELELHPVDVVIVVDDLTSTMAAAIVTKKKGIVLADLVAGTRSFDINMPKEINRLVVSGLSDLMFTAGISSNRNINHADTESQQVYMVGNILIDTLRFNRDRFVQPALFDELCLKENSYLVFTINRRALLANRENLKQMLQAVVDASAGMPVVAPVHEWARKEIQELIPDTNNLHLVSPLSYLEFGFLTSHAKGVITDSGNVAEEATFNRVPCITLNSYTEYIETVNIGSNVLVGEDEARLRKCVGQIVSGTWKECSIPERWDGRTAERIVQILLEYKYK